MPNLLHLSRLLGKEVLVVTEPEGQGITNPCQASACLPQIGERYKGGPSHAVG